MAVNSTKGAPSGFRSHRRQDQGSRRRDPAEVGRGQGHGSRHREDVKDKVEDVVDGTEDRVDELTEPDDEHVASSASR